MKKLILLIVFVLSFSGSLKACDYCNCYLGLNPHYKKNSIGLRYHYLFYRGTHEEDFVLQETGQNKNDFWETRSIYELHAQLYPVQRLQILFSLPYVYNTEHSNPPPITHVHEGHTHNQDGTNKGIGDPVIIAHYQLFNKTSGDTSAKFNHRLFAGGGVKMPLGKWHLESGAEPMERIHLPGSGAVGYISSIQYIARHKKIGLNINASYLVTTTNKEGFRFGNTANLNVLFYYSSRINKFSFYPSTGLYFEHADKDKDINFEIANSGGTILYGHSGVDFYYRKISLSFAAQFPVIQLLNENQPHVKLRMVGGIEFAF